MSSNRKGQREIELNAILESNKTRLLNFIKHNIRDQVEAEDILQEVFAELVESYDIGLAIDSISAWMGRIAKNKVIDRFRHSKIKSDYKLLVEQSSRSEANNSENDWMKNWLQTEITEALLLLPEEQREVFIQHELEGKSFEEISAKTGINTNTLLSRKRYAIAALREHLKEIYDELE